MKLKKVSDTATHSELLESPSYDDIKDKFSRVTNIIIRHKIFIALWCLLIALIALFYLKITPSTFSSEASIILEPKRQAITTSEIINNSSSTNLDSSQTESQIQVIKSERLMRTVFDSLKISEMDEFKYGNPTFFENALRYFGFKRKIVDLSTVDEESKLTIAFNNFSSRLNVRRIGQSYVLELSMYSLNAETSARLANSIAMQYIKQQIESKAALSQSGSEYLQGRIAKFKDQLDLASKAVQLGVVPIEIFPDADARIIGAAVKPLNRSSPQRSLILLFSFIIGPICGIVIILALRIFDTFIANERQLRRLSKLECLAEIDRKAFFTKHIPIESTYRGYRPGLQKKLSAYQISIEQISSFIVNINSSSQPKCIAMLFISNDARVLNLSFEVADKIAAEDNNVLFIIDEVSSVYNLSEVKENRRRNQYSAEKKYGGTSELVQKETISPRFKTIDLSLEKLNNMVFKNSTALYQVVKNLNSYHTSIIDISSVDTIYRLRSVSSVLDGIIVIVDNKFTKVSDWNIVQDKMLHLNIPILATVLVV